MDTWVGPSSNALRSGGSLSVSSIQTSTLFAVPPHLGGFWKGSRPAIEVEVDMPWRFSIVSSSTSPFWSGATSGLVEPSALVVTVRRFFVCGGPRAGSPPAVLHPPIDADVVRPDAEAPLVAADEVSMIVGDPKIVNGFVPVGVFYRFNHHPLAIMAEQLIPFGQFARVHPSLIAYPERMLATCSDLLPVHLQYPDPSGSDKKLLY